MKVNLIKHARWCSGGCRTWLATGAPTCVPDPCWCWKTKADAPEWGRDRCWWKDKVTGKFKSRCPCWGARRENKPAGCCALHLANPQYLDVRAATFLAMTALADPDATKDAHMAAPGEDPGAEPGRPDDDGLWDDWDDMPPNPYAVVRMPYVARWTPEELHCPCTAPDGWPKQSSAVHCTSCCESFANPSTFSLHRRHWTQPCRVPEEITDVDTGRMLLYQDGAGVWRDWYPTAA